MQIIRSDLSTTIQDDQFRVELLVIDLPHDPNLDGCAYIGQDGHSICLSQEMAEELAIELMRAYGLQWWPEPEDDAP